MSPGVIGTRPLCIFIASEALSSLLLHFILMTISYGSRDCYLHFIGENSEDMEMSWLAQSYSSRLARTWLDHSTDETVVLNGGLREMTQLSKSSESNTASISCKFIRMLFINQPLILFPWTHFKEISFLSFSHMKSQQHWRGSFAF